MKRFFDFIFSSILITLLLIPILIIAFGVFISSKGSILYWSNRIGKNNIVFRMPKFRTMNIDTPELATHAIDDADSYLSPIGSFLRKTSMDELPQLFSIIKGDMSFVGPRPALFNQYDLIELRTNANIDKLVPGVTGLAQVNGRDNLSIKDKVRLDEEYMKIQSFNLDLKIIWKTLLIVIKQENITH